MTTEQRAAWEGARAEYYHLLAVQMASAAQFEASLTPDQKDARNRASEAGALLVPRVDALAAACRAAGGELDRAAITCAEKPKDKK